MSFFVLLCTRDDIDWYSSLPYSISIPAYSITIVHAGLVPKVPLSDQSERTLTSIRNIKEDRSGDSLQLLAIEQIDEGVPWAEIYNAQMQGLPCSERKHIIFGHDAKRGLQQYEFATGLDTGCCYGRSLTALCLPSNDIVSVDARRIYEIPGQAKKKTKRCFDKVK